MQISEQQTSESLEKPVPPKERPLGFSILLIFSFVYNGILLALMITGLIYPGVVRDVLQQYFPSSSLTTTTAFLLTLGGTFVFGVSLAGVILLWIQRRPGFYLYAAGQVIMLTSLVFVLKSYDFINISIALVIVIIFGLYSRGMK